METFINKAIRSLACRNLAKGTRADQCGSGRTLSHFEKKRKQLGVINRTPLAVNLSIPAVLLERTFSSGGTK